MKTSQLFTLVGSVAVLAGVAVFFSIVAAVAVAVVGGLVSIVTRRDYQDIPTVMDNPQPYLYFGL